MAVKKIAFVCDDIRTFDKAHDSTWAIMLEAHKRGHQVDWCTTGTLGLDKKTAYASFQNLSSAFFKFNTEDAEYANSDDAISQNIVENKLLSYPKAYPENNPGTHRALDDFDYIFMRKDPPFNMNYVFATNVLSFCEKAKVINNPRALRDYNEKLSILNFPDLISPSIVSKSKRKIKKFLEEQGRIVIKPLDGKGGEGIFAVDTQDKNFASIVESLSNYGERFIMAQKFIPEIETVGDKRIVLVKGEAIGSMLRIPSTEDNRGNMAAGAKIARYDMSERDKEICAKLKDFFIENDIFFAGIDIIGDYLTEINITSPTCLQEINRLNELSAGAKMESQLLDRLEL